MFPAQPGKPPEGYKTLKEVLAPELLSRATPDMISIIGSLLELWSELKSQGDDVANHLSRCIYVSVEENLIGYYPGDEPSIQLVEFDNDPPDWAKGD